MVGIRTLGDVIFICMAYAQKKDLGKNIYWGWCQIALASLWYVVCVITHSNSCIGYVGSVYVGHFT